MNNKLELKRLIVNIVASIPEGKVASYGQVAKLCGYKNHSRYVGTVLKQLPKDTLLPWHRVINSQGGISFPVGSPSYIKQQSLLAKEGIRIANGKIAMKHCGWKI